MGKCVRFSGKRDLKKTVYTVRARGEDQARRGKNRFEAHVAKETWWPGKTAKSGIETNLK